jgi:hypothetical protein
MRAEWTVSELFRQEWAWMSGMCCGIARLYTLARDLLAECAGWFVGGERLRTASSRASRSARDTTRLPRPVSSDAEEPGRAADWVSRDQNALLEYAASAGVASCLAGSTGGFTGEPSMAGLLGSARDNQQSSPLVRLLGE